MSKFRWCYIGAGNIAGKVAANTEKGEHIVSSVYSRNFEKAKIFAEKHNAVAYETVEEAISDCDAVYIATPHTSHVEYAVKAMKMGKPVLCEKPVAVREEDVDILIETAKESNVYFCEAMWTWFSPVAQKVREWIKAGEIGQVKTVTITYAFPGLMKPKTSRVRDPKTAGGSLLDIGIYPITYCFNLFGYPDEIICEGDIEGGIDVAERILLRYGNTVCKLSISFKYLKESCTIIGEKGRISIPLFHVAAMANLKNENGKQCFRGVTDYLNEFNAVAKEIQDGKKESEYVSLDTTKQCMRIMDECRRQMKLVYPFEKRRNIKNI